MLISFRLHSGTKNLSRDSGWLGGPKSEQQLHPNPDPWVIICAASMNIFQKPFRKVMQWYEFHRNTISNFLCEKCMQSNDICSHQMKHIYMNYIQFTECTTLIHLETLQMWRGLNLPSPSGHPRFHNCFLCDCIIPRWLCIITGLNWIYQLFLKMTVHHHQELVPH